MPPIAHPPTPWKVAIVTGLSDPKDCCLSAAQLLFLDQLRARVEQVTNGATENSFLQRNFPFVCADANSVSYRPPSLLRASLNNGWQYVWAGSASYRRLSAVHWQTVLNSTGRLLLITGSCGLQLAIEGLRATTSQIGQVNVLALGPVGKPSLAQCTFQVTAVQGERDWLSQRFFATDIVIPGLRHLEYWSNTQVQKVAAEWLLSRISEL